MCLCRASMAEPFESSQCVDLDEIIFIYTCIRKCIQWENIRQLYFSDLWLKRDQARTFKIEKYQYVKVKI